MTSAEYATLATQKRAVKGFLQILLADSFHGMDRREKGTT
jgi:hypothetical protein